MIAELESFSSFTKTKHEMHTIKIKYKLPNLSPGVMVPAFDPVVGMQKQRKLHGFRASLVYTMSYSPTGFQSKTHNFP